MPIAVVPEDFDRPAYDLLVEYWRDKDTPSASISTDDARKSAQQLRRGPLVGVFRAGRKQLSGRPENAPSVSRAAPYTRQVPTGTISGTRSPRAGMDGSHRNSLASLSPKAGSS